MISWNFWVVTDRIKISFTFHLNDTSWNFIIQKQTSILQILYIQVIIVIIVIIIIIINISDCNLMIDQSLQNMTSSFQMWLQHPTWSKPYHTVPSLNCQKTEWSKQQEGPFYSEGTQAGTCIPRILC